MFYFINGLALSGRISVAYVYFMELLPAENRTFVGTILLTFETFMTIAGVLYLKYLHTSTYLYL